MVRGLYTGASSMAARILQMDTVANNLANVNTPSFKKEETIFKAFPEMMISRQDDDGVHTFPLGSWDKAPVIGKLGTGVEVNENYTHFAQGSVRETENPFDFALEGKGFFEIKTPDGMKYTRNGDFTMNHEGILTTKDGYPVMGENGEIRAQVNNFSVNNRGEIWGSSEFVKEGTFVQQRDNGFSDPIKIDTLKIVNFDFDRYLKKSGNSFFIPTEISGGPVKANLSETKVLQGFEEQSNVDPVREMVLMIEVQRAYEASQKSISTADTALDKLINVLGMV